MEGIVINLAMAVLSFYMAEKRGRNTFLAVVGGLLFSFLAPLYYLIAGDSKAVREQKLMQKIGDAVKEQMQK